MKLRYENTADWQNGNFPRRFQRRWSALVCAIGLAAPIVWSASADNADEQIGAVDGIYDGTLMPDVQVSTFRHIDRVSPSRTVSRGISVYPLAVSPAPLKSFKFKSGRRIYDLFDYLSLNRVSGLLVIKDGQIVLEDYELGNNEKSLWVSWSMVKSITSTLVGAAIKDGYISSIDDQVT